MADDRERHRAPGPLPIVRQPSDILGLALQVAAEHGDANPELVQHTTGAREAVTRTTGSIVFDDQPSYLIVVRGTFTARGRGPWVPPELRRHPSAWDDVSNSVQVLVVDIASGRITDSGNSDHYPNLASVWSGRHRLPVLLVANDPRVPGLAMWWERRSTRSARSDSPASRRADRRLRRGLDGQGSPVSGDINSSGFQ